MQNLVRALLGFMLVGWCCSQTLADDAGARWWHFGKHGDANEATQSGTPGNSELPGSASAAPQSPVEPDEEPDWMIKSPFANVSWPRVSLPKVPKPQLPAAPWPTKPDVNAARNAWVEQNPDPEKASPLQAMTDGARRVGQSTRAAWDKTVDVVMQSDKAEPPSSRVAQRDRPPLWKRMFGANDEPPQARTVTEWMAQDRVDP